MMLKKMRLALPALALALAVSGCLESTAVQADENIMRLLDRSTQHATLTSALEQTGLATTLEGEGPYTLFAPTDAAFNAIPAAQRQAILSDPAKLQAVLRHHVVSGNESSARLTDGRTLSSLQGTQLTIARSNGVFRVNTADIVLDNLGASNGVVHVIDEVLLPPGV